MSEDHSHEADFALSAVRAGGRLARQIQQDHAGRAELKADLSPVTVADYASQALIASQLQQAFPEDRLMAEEGSEALRRPGQGEMLAAVRGWLEPLGGPLDDGQVCAWIDWGSGDPGERFWTLDPVDGTKGFLRGEQYAVALALIERGVVVLGALACPNLGTDGSPNQEGEGCAALAIRGQGAWIEPLQGGARRPLRVSAREEPAAARVLRSVESGHTDPASMEALLSDLGITTPPLLMDSQAKYLMLAAGTGDLIFRLISPDRPDYREWIWDQAAGCLLVTEAGGRVSDLTGAGLDFSRGRRLERNRGVLASNGRLHPAALQALQRVRAG
jgi:3'(2'), 5'-bisphosphate nucleotidase